MEDSLHVVTDKLVINDRTREWCILSYPDHPKGCPNYGKKQTCPPFAPYVQSYFDFTKPLFFVVVKFDLASHVAKMHGLQPTWTERQCRNLLYWQQSVYKVLREKVEGLFVGDKFKVTYIPEAMGVDVFETCKNLGIQIERNPQHYVHKVAMVGKDES